MDENKYPELSKVEKLRSELSVVSEFIDFIRERYDFCPRKSEESLLEEFFEIDGKKLEDERAAVLEGGITVSTPRVRITF